MADSASPEFLALQQALAGRYSLIREIGRGGMGVVYLARDVNLDRSVAIKLMPPAMAGDPELRERFLREARTAAQLSHPNIVPIHLVEERDGLVYFVMTVVDGESLGERVRRAGPLRTGEAVRLIQEVAWALAYAHGRGVIHRDIKPDNILIERITGRALLTDFGIARNNTAVGLTTPGLVMGTLQYMAPEQADADAPIDGRADLYSLGVTAFYALSGRLPFESDRGPALIAAHLLEPAPPVSSVAAGVHPRLAEIVDRCLVKDPANRWATGEALADALTDVGQTSRAMPPSIRIFVTAITGAGGQLVLLMAALAWSSLIVPDQIVMVGTILGLIALAPLIPILEAARAVAIAGYSAADVGSAVAADRLASDGYTQHVEEQFRQSAKAVNSRFGRFLIGGIGVAQLVASMDMLVGVRNVPVWWKILIEVAIAAVMLWMGVELVGHALQLGPFKTRVTRYVETARSRGIRLTDALWTSLPVRALLGIGRLFAWKKKRVPTVASTRPTESILAGAAADVFAGLPAGDRAALSAVPEVVRRLEALATQLRTRKAALDQAIGAVGDLGGGARRAKVAGDMVAEREVVSERLRATVEGLENLRLDLLRLRAGVGSPVDLTEAIEAARQIGLDVTFTLEGRSEAERVV